MSKKTNLQIVFKPEKTLSVQQRTRFTKEDEEFLFQKLHSHYENFKALDRDILSVKLVVSKRDGATSTDVFRAKHLMITRNSLLRHISKELMEANKQTPHQRVPPVEHISKVAASLWLELGPSERIDISRKQLVSACSKVAAIRPEIIEKLHSTLQRIVPEKAAQFATMMSNPHYMRVAMDSVVGSERYITDKTALEAFDRLGEEMVAAEKQKSNEDQRRRSKKHKEQLNEVQLKLQSMTQELEQRTFKRWRRAEKEALPILKSHMLWCKLASFAWIVAVVAATGVLTLFVPSALEGFAKYATYSIAAFVAIASAYYGLHDLLP